MVTYSSILARKAYGFREDWQPIVHGVARVGYSNSLNNSNSNNYFYLLLSEVIGDSIPHTVSIATAVEKLGQSGT